MSNPLIALSTVADGNMYIPDNPTDPTVINNRQVFLSKVGLSLETTTRLNVNMLQRATVTGDTNFCRYAIVSDQDKGKGMRDNDVIVADALVTTNPGHALFLPLADCIGTVFYDESQRVLMLSHLGRHSLEQNGTAASIQFLHDHFGCQPSDLSIWLTPAPSKEAYPIWTMNNKGMKEVIFEQFAAAGVHPYQIVDNPAETDKDPRFFSYTNYINGRSSDSGRHAMVAMIR